jgi:protein-tyrosine phosphatase
MTSQPIEHCYWVVPDKFLAGEYPRDKDKSSSISKINSLIGAGVSAFTDLTEKDEGLLPYSELIGKASHQRFPIPDISIPESSEITVAVLDTIDHHISQGQVVYLHCWGGVGRTGVMVGCWLARHGFKGQAALDRLHRLWQKCPKSQYRESPETEEQKLYILRWEEST